MSDMIERVARALARHDDPKHENWWPSYEMRARAAIEAMRRPTERMLREAGGLTDLVVPYKEANTPEARQDEFFIAWAAMIDEALSEGKP